MRREETCLVCGHFKVLFLRWCWLSRLLWRHLLWCRAELRFLSNITSTGWNERLIRLLPEKICIYLKHLFLKIFRLSRNTSSVSRGTFTGVHALCLCKVDYVILPLWKNDRLECLQLVNRDQFSSCKCRECNPTRLKQLETLQQFTTNLSAVGHNICFTCDEMS